MEDTNVGIDYDYSSRKLPKGWSEHIDEVSGNTYFFNAVTRETSWEPPLSTPESVNPPEAGMLANFGHNINQTTQENKVILSLGRQDIMKVETQMMENISCIEGKEGTTEIITSIEEKKENSAPTVEEHKEYEESEDEIVEAFELPDGWLKHIDETTKKIYYHNVLTGETSWDIPFHLENSINAPQTAYIGVSESLVENLNINENKGDFSRKRDVTSRIREQNDAETKEIPENWINLKDESTGRDYFLNKLTNETTWNIPVNVNISNKKEMFKSMKTNGESEKKTPSFQEKRARPSHAFASFGFGGRLCIHRPGCGNRLEIHKLHLLLPSHPLVLTERKKKEHGIFGALNRASDYAVSSYIQAGVKERSADNLLNLIQIASISEGRLRSDEGVADTSSPESMIIQLFLQNDVETKENQDLPPPSSKVENTVNDTEVLERVESLLLHGKREEGVNEAVAGNQFALALLVASMCDRKTFHIATKQFAEKVLKNGSVLHTMALLFSGQLEPPSDNELERPSMLPTVWSNSTEKLLDTWRQHLCAIISNRVLGWDRIVLSLGDRLLELGDVHAAHCCYMVCGCPLSSVLNSSSRMTLIGCDHLVPMDVAMMTEEGVAAFVRSEAYEWAKRKGNPDAVIRSLQAFKLAYAMNLADLGFKEAAEDYIKSIRACISDATLSASVSAEGEYPSVWSLSNNGSFLSFLNDFENRLSYEKNPETTTYFQDTLQVDGDGNDPLGMSERSHYTSVPPLKSITANAADEDISFLSTKTNLFENPIDLMHIPGSPRTPYDAGHESRLNGGLLSAHNENTNVNLREITSQGTKDLPSVTQGDASFLETPEVRIKNVPGEPEPLTLVPAKFHIAGVNGTSDLRLKSKLIENKGMKSNEASEKGKKEPFSPPLSSEANKVIIVKDKISLQPVPITKGPNKEKLKITTPSTVSEKVPKKKRNKPLPSPHSAPAELQKTGFTLPERSLLDGFRNRMTKWLNPDAKQADLGGNMEAYFDEDHEVWVFPGEDPAEKVKPIGPPPKAPVAKIAETKKEDPKKLDPLAAMMAPPPRAVLSLRRAHAVSRPPLKSTPLTMIPPDTITPTPGKDTKAPPTFMVFKPKDN
mmetsp:Transcript_36586/g.41744  ORF Transcript_36586/g.41744 Transcript_36586/m.41744 type:complete len:1104 (-) Transcript_36586:145-3456(-)